MRLFRWIFSTLGKSCLWLLLLSSFLPVSAGEFQINGLQARLVDGNYLASAEIGYHFSDKAFEALLNGVPLTLDVHLQLRRSSAWIWEADLAEVKLRYQIRYHALAGLYQVIDLQSGSQQNFVTRAAALTALGRLSGVKVIEQSKLEVGEDYTLALRSTLDIEALPMPLRPMAYLSPDWSLSSGWSLWHLRY